MRAWFDPELGFVARASVTHVTPASAANVTDWQKVVDLALHHRVLAHVLRFAGASLPEQYAAQIRAHVENNSKAALANIARTLEVYSLLEADGLRPLIIKGPLLSFDLFHDYGTRVSGDVDVLMPKHQFVRAAQVLSARGYTHHTSASASALKRHRRTEHDVAFAHPVDNILIEIHGDIAQPHYAYRVNVDEFWQGARVHSVGGRDVRVPSLEYAYLIAVLHAARHRWSRLDLIADIAAFQCLPIDNAIVQKRAKQAGVMRIVQIAEQMADMVRRSNGHENETRITKWIMENIARGRGFSRWQGFRLDMAVREHMADRLRYAIRRGLRRPRRSLQ